MPGLLDPLSSWAPAAVATGAPGNRRIDLFFTIPDLGRASVPNLWHKYWKEGIGWLPRRGWHQRGGFWTSAVAATAYSGGRVDVFGRGRSHGLWQTTGLGNDLSRAGEWQRVSHEDPVGWHIYSAPAALATGPADFLISVLTDRYVDGVRRGKHWFRSTEGGNEFTPATWRWRPYLADRWPANRGSMRTAMGMASRRPGSLDMFNVNRAFRLLHTSFEDGEGGPWGGFDEPGGGSLTSTPSIAVWQNPRGSSMHVVTCHGPFPLLPGAVALKSWSPAGWKALDLIYIDGRTDGRGVASPPVVVSWGKPRLDVFFVSSSTPYRSDLKITHGVSENGRTWDFSEKIDLPNLQ